MRFGVGTNGWCLCLAVERLNCCFNGVVVHEQVSSEEGQALAKQWSCQFYEASAKEKINSESTLLVVISFCLMGHLTRLLFRFGSRHAQRRRGTR